MPVALVSGTSTGIGRATTFGLASAGWTGFAGVRSNWAQRSLVDEGGDGVHSEQGGRLDDLVNNAGIGVGGRLEAVSREDLRHQLEVGVEPPRR